MPIKKRKGKRFFYLPFSKYNVREMCFLLWYTRCSQICSVFYYVYPHKQRRLIDIQKGLLSNLFKRNKAYLKKHPKPKKHTEIHANSGELLFYVITQGDFFKHEVIQNRVRRDFLKYLLKQRIK